MERYSIHDIAKHRLVWAKNLQAEVKRLQGYSNVLERLMKSLDSRDESDWLLIERIDALMKEEGIPRWKTIAESGDCCQGCGKPTNPNHPKYERGYYVNRTPADDGWLCGYCGGYECDACDKDIYVDCEVRIKEHGYNYHEECAIKLIRANRLEVCDIEWGMSEWALEEAQKEICAYEKCVCENDLTCNVFPKEECA